METFFSVDDYLSGKPYPKVKPKTFYIYGIARNKKDNIEIFIVSSQEKLENHVKDKNLEVLLIKESNGLKYNEVLSLSEKLLQSYLKENLFENSLHKFSSPKTSEISGKVATFADGEIHTAILLSDEGEDYFALFLSSHIKWAKKKRLASKEEIQFCGYSKNDNTHLVPVLRPKKLFSISERQFPKWRIDEFLKEFSIMDAV